MAKNILYKYNPETDNFERAFPSFKTRVWVWSRICLLALVFAVIIFFIVFYCFDSPTEENLRDENRQLRTQYNILSRRLDNSLKVMERIRERDDNFYRVMMQMEPMGRTQRLSGLENESRYGQLDKMGDADLIRKLTLQMNLMERQIFAQVQSFDQLREEIGKDKEKINHIPSIIPLNNRGFSLASGFGQRRDVITGQPKSHEGIDFAASSGTPIFATADGVVEVAERKPGFGNCIEINHGYNYLSRYAHLSEFMVEAGENVKRGQIIGRVGSSGVSTSPHLHYEVRFKGEAQNPVNYFFMDLDAHEFSEMIQKAENAGHIMD